MSRIYVLLAALAVIGTITAGAYMKGRSDGRSVEAARNAEIVRELNEELRQAELAAQEREQERLREVAELEASITELRRQADADPDAGRRAIGADSVRRIGSIGGPPED